MVERLLLLLVDRNGVVDVAHACGGHCRQRANGAENGFEF